MKNILKYLTIAGVLILFLPFLKCSGDFARNDSTMMNSVNIDTIANYDTLHYNSDIKVGDTIDIELPKYYVIDLPKNNNYKTTNSFTDRLRDLATNILFYNDSLTGIGLGCIFLMLLFSGNILYAIAFLFFFLIIVNSIILIILSFRKKIKLIIILTFSNICMLIISYGLSEIHFNQIKFGSFLFIINSILIIYFAIKHKKLIIT